MDDGLDNAAARQPASRSDDVDSTMKEKDNRLESDSGDTGIESQEPNSPTKEDVSNHYSSSPIPDGGLRAWLQVLSGFMLYLNSWSVIA